jgi:hypothetical protein
MDFVNKSVILTKTQNYSKNCIYTTVFQTYEYAIIFQENIRNEKLPISAPEWQDITNDIDSVNSGTPISNSFEGMAFVNAVHRR